MGIMGGGWMRMETSEGQEGPRAAKRGILSSISARDQPYDHRVDSGCHLGTIVGPFGSIWAPSGLPWSSHLALLFWGAFFHRKRRSKNHPDFKGYFVLGAILAPFFIIFHNFSGNLKNRFWHYLTVLSKVFAFQRLSFWDPVSGPFSVRFWTPQKDAPRAVPDSTIGSFWVVFGPAGGGFRRGVC